MNTNLSHSRMYFWGAVLVLAIMAGLALASGPRSGAAQAPAPVPDCGGLPECGYIQMHANDLSVAVGCGRAPECGYITMHVNMDWRRERTAVSSVMVSRLEAAPECGALAECGYIGMHANDRRSFGSMQAVKPGIPVTGCSGQAQSLYVGQGYTLSYGGCGASLTRAGR